MAESGCLKDVCAQNIEDSSIMLGTSSLVAPIATTGKNVFDTITVPSDATARDFTLDATHLNSVYYILVQSKSEICQKNLNK